MPRCSKIQAQIHYEEDTIDLLKADWSLLTQPSRLQKLAEIYQAELELQPVDARQIVGLDESAGEAGRTSRIFVQPAAGRHGRQAARTGRQSPGAVVAMIGRLPAMISCQDGSCNAARLGDARSSSTAPARRPAARPGTRVVMTMAVFFGIYAAIGGRLVYFGLQDPTTAAGRRAA